MIFFCSILGLSTILFGIVAPDLGSTKLFNIVENYKKYCPYNIVASFFHNLEKLVIFGRV